MKLAHSERRKIIVEESSKTRRAREKLKKKFATVEEKMTTKALEEKMVEMQRWIARHASHRLVLRSKDISLFDENQNAAKISQRVSQIADKLKKDSSNA